MKVIHIGDLHLGKKVHGFDLYDEMQDALNQVLEMVKKEKADGVILAGDVYDQPVPPVESIKMLDEFLASLKDLSVDVYMIAGNHDSAARLEFASRLLADENIYVAGEYKGEDVCITKQKDGQNYHFHLLPFIKPRIVRQFAFDEGIHTYDDAFAWAIGQMDLEREGKHILISHQFFSGSVICESEETVGGLDEISSQRLEPFYYSALGHLHGPQHVQEDKNRYGGTLLKFSTSEIDHKKSFCIVDLSGDKPEIEKVEIQAANDFVRISGTYDELVERSFYRNQNLDHYFDIHLRDEQEVYNAFARLSTIYPKILKLSYDNIQRDFSLPEQMETQEYEKTDPLKLMKEFFKDRSQMDMTDLQTELLEECWQEVAHEAD